MMNNGWNPEKYRCILDKFQKEHADKYTSRAKVYEMIEQHTDISHDTLKRWAKKGNNGPSHDKNIRLKKIADLLGVGINDFYDEPIFNSQDKRRKLICLILDYIESDKTQSISDYSDLENEIVSYRVHLPKEIYDKILSFTENNLRPMAYNSYVHYKENVRHIRVRDKNNLRGNHVKVGNANVPEYMYDIYKEKIRDSFCDYCKTNMIDLLD